MNVSPKSLHDVCYPKKKTSTLNCSLWADERFNRFFTKIFNIFRLLHDPVRSFYHVFIMFCNSTIIIFSLCTRCRVHQEQQQQQKSATSQRLHARVHRQYGEMQIKKHLSKSCVAHATKHLYYLIFFFINNIHNKGSDEEWIDNYKRSS